MQWRSTLWMSHVVIVIYRVRQLICVRACATFCVGTMCRERGLSGTDIHHLIKLLTWAWWWMRMENLRFHEIHYLFYCLCYYETFFRLHGNALCRYTSHKTRIRQSPCKGSTTTTSHTGIQIHKSTLIPSYPNVTIDNVLWVHGHNLRCTELRWTIFIIGITALLIVTHVWLCYCSTIPCHPFLWTKTCQRARIRKQKSTTEQLSVKNAWGFLRYLPRQESYISIMCCFRHSHPKDRAYTSSRRRTWRPQQRVDIMR